MSKKVFVSGCFDMLHSGHVAFFKEASQYGDLYVGIGSDSTIRDLKGRETINSEDERKYMINAIKYVKEAFVNTGSGHMDFAQELRAIKPDFFVVNEDGDSPEKVALCKEVGTKYQARKAMFPMMSNTEIEQVIHQMGNNISGHKLSGAGGGGYLIMVAEKPIENAFRIKIRRKGKD